MPNTMRRKSSRSKPKTTQPEGDVKAFWDSQAEAHGASDLATNPDQHYRKLEIASILRVIGNMQHGSILDVGCGNGFSTCKIAEEYAEANLTGVDFSPTMIDEAQKAYPTITADFYEGDVLSLSRNKDLIGLKFDVVLSTRCLINLANWEEQKVAILEMRKMLKPEGRLILVENFQEGLDNLNALRGTFGLDPIAVRWHNKYIPHQEAVDFFNSIKGHLLTVEYVENIGNMYYIASRVLYAKLCKDQGIEPDYSNPINAIASQLPTMGEYYACSPNFMFILKNEAGHGNARN